MIRQIMHGGIGHSRAVTFESRLKNYGFSEAYIVSTPTPILSTLMQATLAEMQALQQCIGESTTVLFYVPNIDFAYVG